METEKLFSVLKKSFENFNLSQKVFTIDEYQGKEGIETIAMGVTLNPPHSTPEKFVFIGLLKPGMYFSFKSPQRPELIMKYDPPYFKSENKGSRIQIQSPVSDTFKNRRVILLFISIELVLVTGFWETALQNIGAFFNKRIFMLASLWQVFRKKAKKR